MESYQVVSAAGSFLDRFSAYGLEGLIIAVLFIVLVFILLLQHRERKGFNDKYDERAKETNAILRELTRVIERVKK